MDPLINKVQGGGGGDGEVGEGRQSLLFTVSAREREEVLPLRVSGH